MKWTVYKIIFCWLRTNSDSFHETNIVPVNEELKVYQLKTKCWVAEVSVTSWTLPSSPEKIYKCFHWLQIYFFQLMWSLSDRKYIVNNSCRWGGQREPDSPALQHPHPQHSGHQPYHQGQLREDTHKKKTLFFLWCK